MCDFATSSASINNDNNDNVSQTKSGNIIVTFDKNVSKQIKSSSGSCYNNVNNNQSSQPVLLSPEVEKNVREFSRCTALYTMLIISIGTMRDSGKLREDISTVRQRGWELANYNKSLLVPRMRQANDNDNCNNSNNANNSNNNTTVPFDSDYRNLERIFFMFCSCLEFFMEQLLRTVDLLANFQLNSNGHPDNINFINSGLTDSMPGCLYLRAAASSISASPLNSPVPSTARRHSAFNFRFNAPRLKQTQLQSHQKHSTNLLVGQFDRRKIAENHEFLLKKDIKAIKDLILEIHSSIPMTPWTIQPQYHLERQANNGSLVSLADSSDECGLDSTRSSTCKYPDSGSVSAKMKKSRQGTGSGPHYSSSKNHKNRIHSSNKRRCTIITIMVFVATFLVGISIGVSIRLLL